MFKNRPYLNNSKQKWYIIQLQVKSHPNQLDAVLHSKEEGAGINSLSLNLQCHQMSVSH